jgi:hypothetical protein
MKRVGPELKFSDLKKVKVPDFASDLYYDLRDRRLLPLVGLVLVAIVAMPFLLGGGSEELEPAPESIGGAPTETAQTSSLTVVEAQPGLRDYRKRLAGRTPTNPFKQRYTGPSGEGGLPNADTGLSSAPTSGDSASEGTSGSPPAPAPETAPPSSDGGSGETSDGDLRLFTFAVDVKISSVLTKADGKKEKSEPEVRKGIVPPTALPSPKTQVVTYMGISPKTRKPLFLISDDVESIFGEAKCLSGSESCQLLEVELGLPTTFVYEPTGARYKINVIKVEPVFRGRFDG